MTSRGRCIGSGLVEDNDIIPVEPMKGSQAIALFEKNLGGQATREEIHRLTSALDFMPPAIVQAALYIKQMIPRYSVKQYIDDFSKSDRKNVALFGHKGCLYEEMRRRRTRFFSPCK